MYEAVKTYMDWEKYELHGACVALEANECQVSSAAAALTMHTDFKWNCTYYMIIY